MCIALDMAQEINDKIHEAEKIYNELCIKERVINDIQNDLLHKIEDMDKFDLYEGWKVTKALHSLRRERRQIKNEKYNMELFLNNVKEVNSKVIKKADKRQNDAIIKKEYKKRVSSFLDPIHDINNALEIINSSDKISRTSLQKNIKIANTKLYTSTDALPKEQGTCIRFQLKGKQIDLENTYTKNLIKKYESYKMLSNNIIYLINRL